MPVVTVGPKQRWKGLSTDVKPTSQPGDEFFETDTGLWKEYDDPNWVTSRSNGATNVTQVQQPGALQTRTIIALTGTRQRLTFNPPINAAAISVRGGLAAAPDADEAVVWCINASTTVIADDWLNEANTAPRRIANVKEPLVDIEFSSPVTHIDLKGVGTTIDLDVTVMGLTRS